MENLDHLTKLINEQGRIVNALEKAVKDVAQADLVTENEELTRQKDHLTSKLKSTQDELNKLANDNQMLKDQLFDHMFNERARLLRNSQDRANAYFSDQMHTETNRLLKLEMSLKSKCDEYTEYLCKNRIETESSLSNDLIAFKTYAQEKIDELRQQAEEAERSLYMYKDNEMNRLREEPLSVEEAARHDKQNNMESFLGLKILNKLGIILIILGVIALGQYTLVRIPNEAKSALIFLLGLLMLAGGEILNRKKTNVFSLGLTSGGISILYLATALSFFYMKIMGAPAALMLCVLITIVSLILSNRYNAQVIAVFALIGGYLSVMFIKQDFGSTSLIYYQLTYFLLLGLFSLLISFIKKWHIAQYTGFILQFFAVANGIFFSLPKGQTFMAVSLTYLSLIFIIYSLIPLISTYSTKTKLNAFDNILMALNIILGSGMLFTALSVYNRLEWANAILLALCAWHLIIGRLAEVLLKAEKVCQVICYITGLAFAVLIVPVQFGYVYMSLGWLVEGAGLLICGIIMKHRGLKTAGWIISGMCLIVFIMFDFTYLPKLSDAFFIRYLSITVCSLFITASYYYSHEIKAKELSVLKTTVFINTWLFLVYAIEAKVPDVIPASSWRPQYAFIIHMLAVATTFIWAYIIPKRKSIADAYIRSASLVVSVIGILFLIWLNTGLHPKSMIDISATMITMAIIVSIIVNILSVFIFIDIIQSLIVKRVLSFEWYPVFVASFILLLLTQNLYVMMDLSPASLVLTVLFAVAAICFILFGFMKRFLYIRLTGLGLAFAVTVKLFIVDLSFLASSMRIISYFGLGAALLVISFVYQYFDKWLKKGSNSNE